MKLYRKKLSNLEELRREKIRLRYERRHTSAEQLNPLSEIGRSKISGSAKNGLMGTVMELAGSKSQMQMAMAIGKPLLRMLSKRREKRDRDYFRNSRGDKKAASGISGFMKDVAFTFIIGKAIQLSVAGVRKYIRRRKTGHLLHR